MSQQDKVASLRSQLFAQKGLARPASGFRVTAREDQADDGADVRPATAGPIPVRAPVDAGEPEPAAALRPGGFDKADIEHVALSATTHAGPRLAEVATAPDPETGSSDATAGEAPVDAGEAQPNETEAPEPAIWWRAVLQDIRREVLVGVGLLVLVVAGLGLGYLIGTVTRGTPDAAPVAASGVDAAGEPETAAARPAPAETQAPSATAAAPEADEAARDSAAPEVPGGDPVVPAAEANVAATPQVEAPNSEPPVADATPTADAPAEAASVGSGAADAPPPAALGAEAGSDDTATLAALPRPAVKPASSASPGAAYTVQLGSLSSAADARRLWDGIAADHGDLFGGLTLDVQRAVVDGRTFYRARAGTFADVSRARGFCATLRGRGLECLVVRR